jgi:hypothetical protein
MLLQALRNDQSQNFSHTMTEGESWLDSKDESPTMLARARDEVVPRVLPSIGSKKAMITIFFTGTRLLKLFDSPQGQKWNKDDFINEILEGSSQKCNRSAGYKVTKMMKIQLDNRGVHRTPETWQEMRRMKIETLVHPLYSLDPGPCDFFKVGSVILPISAIDCEML